MTIISVEQVAGRDRPKVRLSPGLLQPRLVSRRAGGHAHVALVAGGAVLLGGDTVSIEVRVGTGCTLVVEDVGGTVAYPAAPAASDVLHSPDASTVQDAQTALAASTARDAASAPAAPARAAPTGEGVSTWDVDIEVADGGRLIWETFPFVVATGARVSRSTRVRFGTESAVCLRETIVLGRTGETGGAMTSSTDVRDCTGGPVFVEDLAIDGNEPLPGVLGEASVLDTAMLFGRRSRTEDSDHQILDLASPGAIARAVGKAAHASHVDVVWDDWTQLVLEPCGNQDDHTRVGTRPDSDKKARSDCDVGALTGSDPRTDVDTSLGADAHAVMRPEEVSQPLVPTGQLRPQAIDPDAVDLRPQVDRHPRPTSPTGNEKPPPSGERLTTLEEARP